MSEQQSTRRNFLKLFGLSAGVTLTGASALGAITQNPEIRKLNPEQQEFMVRYGKWMDEFSKAIKAQKANPNNSEYQKKVTAVAEKAKEFQPELAEFMKDETFELVFRASIEKVSKVIET